MHPARSIILWIATLLIVGMGCSQSGTPGNVGRSIGAIKASGKLIVATRNAPTTYHFNAEGQAVGPEHDLAVAFANNLGVQVEFVLMDTISEVLQAVKSGQVDFGAAGLSKTRERSQSFLFGPSYQQVTQQVVCRQDLQLPRKVDDLVGLHLVILKGSSYAERMKELKTRHPDLKWEETDELSTEQILEQVWEQEVDCTIADSIIVKINRRYFPDLIVAFDIQRPEPLAWVLSQDALDLRAAINQWLQFFRRSKQLDVVLNRYYAYIPEFDLVNLKAFQRHIKERNRK